MAFSIRKIISNITNFKKPEGSSDNSETHTKQRRHTYVVDDPTNFENLEPDSTSRYASLQLPDSVKKYAAKKGSLSDTDILTLSEAPMRHKRRKCKKLKIDIKKASQSMNQIDNVENTPKHVLLECNSSDAFSERLKSLDLNKSFDLYDEVSDIGSSFEEEDLEIDSLSEHSDSSPKSPIRMCRKIPTDDQSTSDENRPVPSTTPESFADVELDKNEEERTRLLLNYQMKLEKLECFLKQLLTEFQFHIEVSKIFHSRSIVTALPGSDLNNIPKNLVDVYVDTLNKDLKDLSPSGTWNVIMEKEDKHTKTKVRKQLIAIKNSIEQFVHIYLHNQGANKKFLLSKKKGHPKRFNISHKKKQKHFDFPDLRDAMIQLFSEQDDSMNYSFDDCKCICKCHQSSPTQTDSGLNQKSPEHSTSITSSIGNFTLDSTTLTAYSESLDQIISYNSFQDSFYGTFLQKATIERITFYIQVHSIQLKCEQEDREFESKQCITFHCPSCKNTENDENGLLKHILSQSHCEKIHFLYKTAYIKKCVAAGKEIQPSTVLNPMTLYRDDNKIVCFGDALYACSLCFENLIEGESVLMAHCSDPYHVERKEKLLEIEL